MTPTPTPEVVVPRRVRHKVRGTTYEIVGVGRAQGVLHDDDPVILYRDENDGGLWVRHQAEFSDGRFEYLAASPQPVVAPSDLSGEDGLSKTIPTEQSGDVAPQTVDETSVRLAVVQFMKDMNDPLFDRDACAAMLSRRLKHLSNQTEGA